MALTITNFYNNIPQQNLIYPKPIYCAFIVATDTTITVQTVEAAAVGKRWIVYGFNVRCVNTTGIFRIYGGSTALIEIDTVAGNTYFRDLSMLPLYTDENVALGVQKNISAQDLYITMWYGQIERA